MHFHICKGSGKERTERQTDRHWIEEMSKRQRVEVVGTLDVDSAYGESTVTRCWNKKLLYIIQMLPKSRHRSFC